MTIKISLVVRTLAIGMVAALVLVGTAMGEVSRNGLVAEWHFDGDAKDSSGNGNDGTIQGGTFVDGKIGKALLLDGISSRVDLPNLFLTQPTQITFEALVKPNNVGPQSVIYNGNYESSIGFGDGNKIGVSAKLTDHTWYGASATWSASAGTWYQIDGIVDLNDRVLKLYINGNLEATENLPAGQSLLTPACLVRLGAWHCSWDNPGSHFGGVIDEVRIYNRALSQSEVKANYEASKSPSSQPTPSTTDAISMTGLVAEYHFDGDARDSSGNGNDGTIHGATFVAGDNVNGKALSFNGNGDYVEIPYTALENLVSGTIIARIKLNSNNDETIIAKQHDNVGTYGVFSIGYYVNSVGWADAGTPGKLYFHGHNPVTEASSSSVMNTGQWYHVAVVFTNTYAKFYIDGSPSNTLNDDYSIPSDTTTPTIGAWLGDGGGRYFNGIIDEVQIYNRALSAEEIKANYGSTIGKSPATVATKSASAPTSSPATPAPTTAQTTRPTPAPTAAPESSNSYIYAGIGGLVLILVAIVALKRRSSSKVEEPLKREPAVKPEPQKPTPLTDSSTIKPAPITMPEASGIYVKTAFGYKGATIIYKVKVENNTNEPISDIKVYLYVPNVFMLREKEKTISLIEPRSSQTATFEIRPSGECGDCNVSGRVNYYDMVSKKHLDIELESKSLSIICPMLRRKEISEDAWRDLVSGLVKAEETTTDVPVDGEGLFGIISEILKDLNLFMLPPGINKAPQIFRGTARFYGEGVKGLRYGAQIEVVGGARKSKLILKAWAEKEDALTGFYHGVLDEIEKRVKVKEYIDDSIVQYNIQIGDKIGTLVKDSVIQRSNIGASAQKCPECGREVEANEKFCLECGAKL